MATALLRKLTARQCQCTIPLRSQLSQTIKPSIGYTPHFIDNNAYRPTAAAATGAAAPIDYRMFSTSSNDASDDFSADDGITPYIADEIPPPSFHRYDEDVSAMTNSQLSDPTTIPGFTALIHSPPKNPSTPRNALVGRVVSDKMDKTVNVAVDRYRIVPKYRKRIKYTRKFMAHDEGEECGEGDLVMIVPCQRMSKRKHYRVQEILKAKGIL